MTDTVTINAVEYPVYGDLDAASEYLAAASHAHCWLAEPDELKKKRWIVTTARILNRQPWKGTKVAADQPLAWPRTGTDVDGVTDDVIPQDIIDASFELQIMLADGVDIQSEANTTNKLTSIQAGSVSLSFYHGADSMTPERFPTILQELLAPYLEGPSPASAGVTTGTDGETITGEDHGFSGGI